MNVAYLINQYPKVSHTFIRREIAERYLTPLTTFLFSLFGCSAAIAFSKRGKSHIFAVTLGVIIAYYVLITLVPSKGLASLPETILRASIPSMFLMLVAFPLYFTCDRIKKIR